jgi:hypothetical protein
MSVCCECSVLSRRGLCDGLITRPEESYRLWRVVMCDQETSNEEAKARYWPVENTTKRVVTTIKQTNNVLLCVIYQLNYRRPSKVERNPFQEAVRLSICSTFELKWHEPHDAVQCRNHGSTFEFLFEFQTEFFSNFLYEFQVVRESNRSTFEGPLYTVLTYVKRMSRHITLFCI